MASARERLIGAMRGRQDAEAFERLACARHSRRAVFALPDDRRIVCSVAFGYEDATHPANRFGASRAPVSEAVDWVED